MSNTDAASAPHVTVGDDGAPADHHAGEVPVKEFFLWIYRFFYSKVVGVLLILALAILAVIGSLVMQAPPGVLQDPTSRADFLEAARTSYGGWTGILDALGFFHIFTSVIFYVIVAMLAASIIACTVHRLPQLWQRNFHPRTHVAKKFFDKARYRGSVPTQASTEQALAATTAVLKSHRFRVMVDERDPKRALYADRYAWSGVGTVVAHISFVMILMAFVISSTWGIEEDLSVPIGRPIELGHDTELTLEATSFSDTYTEEGRPSDYVSHLILREGDQVVAEQDVRVNTPLGYDGIKYHQSSFGIAADVIVKDLEGGTVFEESVPLKWKSKDGTNAIGKFQLPESELEVIVVVAASGANPSSIPAGTAKFEVYADSTSDPVAVVSAPQGDAAEAGEYSFGFERERQYTGIRMRQDPGAVWMWIGSTLLVVGMCVTFAFQYRRLWIRIDEPSTDQPSVNQPTDEQPERRVRFGAVSKLDASYERLFETIVDDVNETLQHTSPASEENTRG